MRLSDSSKRLLHCRNMVELRKRPAPPPAPAPAAKKKAGPKGKAKKDEPKVEEAAAVAEEPATTDNAAAEDAAKDAIAETAAKITASSPPKQGDKIDLEGFGGEIETNEGDKVTLAQLVKDSKQGVVLFTYPKASTP